MGKIHIYYGDGKGKTTAAAGLAVRYAASGGRVIFCQFLKNGSLGEIKLLSSIDNISCVFSDKNYGFTWQMTEQARKQAAGDCNNILKYVKNNCSADCLIVLDEILDTVLAGFVDERYLYEFILGLKSVAEIVLTGHCECGKLFSLADYITYMKKEKHPFDLGLQARKGIEF